MICSLCVRAAWCVFFLCVLQYALCAASCALVMLGLGCGKRHALNVRLVSPKNVLFSLTRCFTALGNKSESQVA